MHAILIKFWPQLAAVFATIGGLIYAYFKGRRDYKEKLTNQALSDVVKRHESAKEVATVTQEVHNEVKKIPTLATIDAVRIVSQLLSTYPVKNKTTK